MANQKKKNTEKVTKVTKKQMEYYQKNDHIKHIYAGFLLGVLSCALFFGIYLLLYVA